ncbi:MAG TPA: hypothetical protein VMX58_07675 [Patescibacteria group bacterium]|nr:hypothetical protein [Patescibacteria group bacterium]
MPFFVGFGAWVLFLLLFTIFIGGFFMWIAAKIAHVKKSSFGRAILAAVVSSIVSVIVSFVFGILPLIGNGIGFLVGLLVSILIIMWAFDTTFMKAILVWVFNIVAVAVAVVLTAIISAGSVMFLPHI